MRRGIVIREPVQVHQTMQGNWPKTFMWRGRRHRVRQWEMAAGRQAEREVGRRLYRVRTATGLRCVLSHDLVSQIWRIEWIRAHAGRES